jgi:cytochrome c553
MNKTAFMLAALLACGGAAAADRAAGEKLAAERCAACHGKDYNTPVDPSYPKLGGDYHSGARKNPVMGGIAKTLTPQDMRNLAAYLGSLPGPLTHKK